MKNKEKEQEILETTSLLFSKVGIKKTSVELISLRCGISKKTFYNYYPDKETIVKEIVKNALYKTERYIITLSKISPNATSELINFFKFLQGNLSVFTPVFISDLLKFYPAVNDFILQFRAKIFLPFFIQNVQRGILENCYRNSVDGRLTGELYFKQIDLALEDNTLTVKEKFRVLSYINNFFLHGLVNGIGAKLLFSDLNEEYCKKH
jgi:AcrR family transcriptional regulator